MIKKKKSVIVIAAHADDETLGCGGTIARHIAEGDLVHVVFMADGVGSRKNNVSSDLVMRNKARNKALSILGVTNFTALDFPDNQMDKLPLLEIVKAIEPIFEKVQPSTVYTHHYGDLNVDHRITHQAVMTVCRPEPRSTIREIYSFEIMSSTEWASPSFEPYLPNTFIDISNYLSKKLEALAAYDIEMRPKGHSRSTDHIISLAHHRGNSVGYEAAESFYAIRIMK